MKTLTPKEANAIVARIFSNGLQHDDCNYDATYTHPSWFCNKCGFYTDWFPYSNNDQAIKALDEWRSQGSRSWSISDLAMEGRDAVEVVLIKIAEHSREYDEDIAIVEHKKLSAAITTALCSAELGEPVEIKEER